MISYVPFGFPVFVKPRGPHAYDDQPFVGVDDGDALRRNMLGSLIPQMLTVLISLLAARCTQIRCLAKMNSHGMLMELDSKLTPVYQ